MEQVKSTKSLAYARLGRPQSSNGSVGEQPKKMKRNSTGNIYEQILQQIHPQANSYIRNLVNKNVKQTVPVVNNDNFQLRRKSYAQIMIDSSSKDKQRKERTRQQRQTLCKSKFAGEIDFSQQQITPKYSTIPINKWTSGSKNSANFTHSSKIMINSFKNQPETSQDSFLGNLTSYLDELEQIPEKHAKVNFKKKEKLSQTLKINSGQSDMFKIAAKLEQSQIKIKELKITNHLQQKQVERCKQRQHKMKQSLFEMFKDIKRLTAQLNFQKKQRKKLERLVDNFQLRRNQPERKTIGKNYLRLQQLQSSLNTQNEYYDYDDRNTFFEYQKNATIDKKKMINAMKVYDNERIRMHGMLNSQKINKLFKSHQNSDYSDV